MYLRLLKNNIRKGILHLHLPDGTTHRFGDQGLEAHWHIRDEQAIKRVARDWEFELGQTYMEGGWAAGEGGLRSLMAILRTNFPALNPRKWYAPLIRLYQGFNNISRGYRNISHHYDTDEEIFRLFLDRDMHYSCAFFQSEDQDLEQAQQNKCAIIARKLLLEPGQRVLDIGCGWGSLAFYLARHHDVHVTGITLSQEQMETARQEAESRQLTNVHFELADYREHQGSYDRVVSVGMLEHVGIDYLPVYFNRIRELLTDDGAALVHTIGNRFYGYDTNPWIDRYIFPGGRIPALSEIVPAFEQSPLMLTDLEVWRMHYAWTLRNWMRRFESHKERVLALKDETFYRMWEFYLVACDVSFEFANLVVFQLQLAKRHGVVPVSRDYLLGPKGQGS